MNTKQETKQFSVAPHIVMFIVALVFFTMFNLWICPRFVDIYEDLGASLLIFTQMVISSYYLPCGTLILLVPSLLAILTKRHLIFVYPLVYLCMSAFTVFSMFIPLIGIMDSLD